MVTAGRAAPSEVQALPLGLEVGNATDPELVGSGVMAWANGLPVRMVTQIWARTSGGKGTPA
jgi:hypothetical protein